MTAWRNPRPTPQALEPRPQPAVCAMPDDGLRLYALLTSAAEAGQACPTNVALMDLLGVHCVERVRDLLRGLISSGLIDIETETRCRRVTILASGRRTGWTKPGVRTTLGAASVNDWTPDLDARLLAMAAEGLGHTTIAQRLNRTPSSVRHRLMRLRKGGGVTTPQSAPELPPALPQARRTPARPRTRPVRADIVTTDQNRPQAERDQIAAFLAQRGDSVVVPAMFAAETTSAHDLAPVQDQGRLARLFGQVRHALKGARFRSQATVIVNLEGAVEVTDLDAMVERGWVKRWRRGSATYIAVVKGAAP